MTYEQIISSPQFRALKAACPDPYESALSPEPLDLHYAIEAMQDDPYSFIDPQGIGARTEAELEQFVDGKKREFERLWAHWSKEPRPTVKLVGQDGNAFNILGIVRRALEQSRASEAYVRQYLVDATAGDYGHLLRVTMQYVEVE